MIDSRPPTPGVFPVRGRLFVIRAECNFPGRLLVAEYPPPPKRGLSSPRREKSQTEYTIRENGTIIKGPPPEEAGEDFTRSALYVPMRIEGQTIGVMQLQSTQLDAYTQEDIDLLTGMANVAAVAVQNARLYDTVQQELNERKRAEEELRKHREHLEELVRERTAELRRTVNLMAGREVRMAELKGVIRKLRAQLEEAGLTPGADDPLGAGKEEVSNNERWKDE